MQSASPPAVEFVGKKGQQLPVKTLGQVPSGLTGLSGMTPQEAVDHWEKIKGDMSEDEIKALGDPMDVQTFDVELIGESFGLTPEQIERATTPWKEGDPINAFQNKKGKDISAKTGFTPEMALIRGLHSTLPTEGIDIDFEGNWDLYNLMNKMHGNANLETPVTKLAGMMGQTAFNKANAAAERQGTPHVYDAQGNLVQNVHERGPMDGGESEPLFRDEMSDAEIARAERMGVPILPSRQGTDYVQQAFERGTAQENEMTAAELWKKAAKLDQGQIKHSAKGSNLSNIMKPITMGLMALATTIATAGAGLTAVGALGGGTLGGGLAGAGIGGLGGGVAGGILGGGDKNAILKGLIGGGITGGLGAAFSGAGAAGQGIQSARVGSEMGMTGGQLLGKAFTSVGGLKAVAETGLSAGQQIYGAHKAMTPGEMLRAQGANLGGMDADAYNEWVAAQAQQQNQLKRNILSGGTQTPLTSSKQLGAL
jgi:hypothetical protein